MLLPVLARDLVELRRFRWPAPEPEVRILVREARLVSWVWAPRRRWVRLAQGVLGHQGHPQAPPWSR
eukprot:scaffold121551_cov44-Prasinocladus_malaysianus.AAC.2